MRVKTYFFILMLFFVCTSTTTLKAQSMNEWTILLLDVAGRTKVDGVEVFSKYSKCQGEDVLYLKIYNHNEHRVTVKWYDAVRNQQLVWVIKEEPSNHKSILIEPNLEITGDCISGKYSECIVKLKDFMDNVNNYKEYGIYHFEVNAVMK